VTGTRAIGFPGQGGDWKAGLRILAANPDHPLVGSLADAFGTGDWSDLDPLDTRHSQPVVFVSGLVAADAAGIGPDQVDAVIGHSLGEVTAACFAGAISRRDALALVQARAELGHAQHDGRPGSMVAIMRLDQVAVEWIRRTAVADRGGVLDVAVTNSATQIVLSGDAATADRAVELAEAAGAVPRRLPIGGAFHSALMLPAVQPFADRIRAVVAADPSVPIVTSTTVTVARRAEELPDLLARSLVLPVDWPAALATLATLGIETTTDIGPGDSLTRLAKHVPGADFGPPP
jgi:[acyl-carrier-protein] S-malonyltransferase